MQVSLWQHLFPLFHRAKGSVVRLAPYADEAVRGAFLLSLL